MRPLLAVALVAGLLGSTPAMAMIGYGSFVSLSDGTMRVVQAIKRGDLLSGGDGTANEVFAVSSSEGVELIRVITSTGREFVVSRDHPVPVRRGNSPFIANGVRLGDEVMTVEGFETVEYITPVTGGTLAYKLSIGEPGTSEKDPLFVDGVMVSDEPF